ncbi:methionine synthase, partial [Candidatus Woesearchaeota archaeon]|nr:methionine synthase [Candidatus Woesearchaeota archaeon]
RNDFYKGIISKEELKSIELEATREIIDLQERSGLDILVDGEFYRGDMVTYFAENLKGFKISGLVWSYGNRYYKKPIIADKIEIENPITVEWFKFAQSLTKKPVKGMVTGPYTIMDWSFDEFYSSREAAALDLARVIHEEVKSLEEAGAKYIQIDEPAISARPEELDLAIKAMKIVTDGIKAKTITHICYGDFEKIYPKMLELPVDQIDLEIANSNFDMHDLLKKYKFTKEIGLGVLDVHSHKVEDKESIKNLVRKAIEIIPKEKIYVDPDCGLKTRTTKEAFQKIFAMVGAVRELREENGHNPYPDDIPK